MIAGIAGELTRAEGHGSDPSLSVVVAAGPQLPRLELGLVEANLPELLH